MGQLFLRDKKTTDGSRSAASVVFRDILEIYFRAIVNAGK